MPKTVTKLNEFQAQHVETTFSHVDKLLEAVEALARANGSPFAREKRDVTPDEARFLAAFVQQMRMRMIAALDRLGLARPKPNVSARYSADVTLRFAEIALADLSAKSLRGYGPVDPEAGAEVGALAADIRELIERGRALFHEQEAGALAERLAGLPGPFGDALRAIERFSAEHALADVRPLLAEAANRVMAQTFDVGVFGRVSSGKSSLINALLGTDVLPVGATPVTAVPLRLHHGDLAAVVTFESGAERAIAIEEIAEFGTEERNPGNRAGVRSIEIAVPTVPPGLRFLDTPGIGSLSASAPAQAFAWLPRCDLGLVLIAAGAPVGTDDLALISGFVNAGITCEILVSKSDLLAPEEIERTVAYVQREVTAVLGDDRAIPVHTVSTIPTAITTLATFRAAVLEPLVASHVAALQDALRTRLHRLVALTRAALAESAVDGAGDSSSDGASGEIVATGMHEDAQHAMLQYRIRREAAHRVIRAKTDALTDSSERVLDAAASAVASAWIEHRTTADAAAAARTAIIREAGAALSTVRKAVDDVRGGSMDTVGTDESDASVSSDVSSRRLPPVFDAEFLNQLPDLSAPRLISAPRHALAERRLAPIRSALATDLGRYANRLYEWGERALKEIPEPSTGSVDTAGSVSHKDAGELARIDEIIDQQPE